MIENVSAKSDELVFIIRVEVLGQTKETLWRCIRTGLKYYHIALNHLQALMLMVSFESPSGVPTAGSVIICYIWTGLTLHVRYRRERV